MRREFTTMGSAVLMGMFLFGNLSVTGAAEEAQKPGAKPKPEAGKAPAAKKSPDKQSGEKSGTAKSKTAASPPAKVPSPTYTSAETAAKSQACFGEAPKIESVMPDEGKAGDKVTITGRNFGSADCIRSLSFGPGHPATYHLESDNRIIATVPSGGRKGLAIVTVTTASGEDSKGFLVR